MSSRLRRKQRASARLLAAACCLGALVSATPASADGPEGSAYCKKVRARAASDAALLYAPTLQAQGLKFPRNGTIDSGVTVGEGYQLRAALSISPLDIYKGVRVERVGEADCQYHEVIVSARELLAQASDHGRLPALRKQVDFLDARRPEWEAILAKSEERVAAHVGSLRDAAEVRARVAALVRAREQHAGEAERLAARGVETFHGSLPALVAAAEREAMRLEREISHVRSLAPWDVRVSGGVIPHDRPVDWFGMVIVGFNLGAFSRNAAEGRYLDARAEELRAARYELRDQVARFHAEVKGALAQARRELAIVERHASVLAADKEALESAEGINTAHALALVALDRIFVESERVFLTTFIAELARLEKDNG